MANPKNKLPTFEMKIDEAMGVESISFTNNPPFGVWFPEEIENNEKKIINTSKHKKNNYGKSTN